MDREWLEDYDAREIEEHGRFLKDLPNGKLPPDNIYPRKDRFTRLQEPISAMWLRDMRHFWSQIPLYGSSIIPLVSHEKEKFPRFFGFRHERELDRLIDLAKIGRIQFTLTVKPTEYAELEYLEPILKELRPPLCFGLPSELFDSQENLRKSHTEFMTITEISLVRYLVDFFQEKYGSVSPTRLWDSLNIMANNYGILRALGYHQIADLTLDLATHDPHTMIALFNYFGILIADRVIHPIIIALDLGGDKHPHKLIGSLNGIQSIIDRVKAEEGKGLAYQAALLMKELINYHPFDGGNHRTAYGIAKTFLRRNGKKFRVKNFSDGYSFIKGVADRSITEVVWWIEHGKTKGS